MGKIVRVSDGKMKKKNFFLWWWWWYCGTMVLYGFGGAKKLKSFLDCLICSNREYRQNRATTGHWFEIAPCPAAKRRARLEIASDTALRYGRCESSAASTSAHAGAAWPTGTGYYMNRVSSADRGHFSCPTPRGYDCYCTAACSKHWWPHWPGPSGGRRHRPGTPAAPGSPHTPWPGRPGRRRRRQSPPSGGGCRPRRCWWMVCSVGRPWGGGSTEIFLSCPLRRRTWFMALIWQRKKDWFWGDFYCTTESDGAGGKLADFMATYGCPGMDGVRGVESWIFLLAPFSVFFLLGTSILLGKGLDIHDNGWKNKRTRSLFFALILVLFTKQIWCEFVALSHVYAIESTRSTITVLSRGVRSLFRPTRKSSPWGNFSDSGLNQSIKRRLSL